MHCYLKPRKDNGIYYIWEYDAATGECRKFSTRTRDPEAAQKKFAEHIIKLPKQEFAGITVVTIMLRYYEHHGQQAFSKSTVRTVMRRVVDLEPETRLDEFSPARQKEFCRRLNVSPSTQRRYHGIVRAAAQWSFDNGDIPQMPAFYKPVASDGEGVRPFELPELRALFGAAVHEHERRFLLLCLSTAPRPGATLDLTWDRIKNRVANYIVPGRRKTKKRRAIAPLCDTAAAYLEAHRSIGPVIQFKGRQLKGFKMTFRRLAKRAGVVGTAYGIRKAVSIWMRKEGVPEWDIKGMLAHRIGGETERYAHYRPEYMRAAADSVEHLLREICPGWLASYLPVRPEDKSAQPQVLVVNGFIGAHAVDRTRDPHHVKGLIVEEFQGLIAANDD
jgi:integrase